MVVVVLVFGSAPTGGQWFEEPDPCAHAYGRDLTNCWAREVERSEDEMNALYRVLRERLPDRASKNLEKAQKLWLEFRDAHLKTQYGVESPVRTWGLDYPVCLSISRVTLNRARTRELRRPSLLPPRALSRFRTSGRRTAWISAALRHRAIPLPLPRRVMKAAIRV